MTDDEPQATAHRTALVDQIEHDLPHLTAPTLAAMRQIPRHAFIPGVDLATAYADDAVVTRRDREGRALSSISQPSLVAQMLDMLDLQPGHRVLEIGAGTGWCAALLAELVGSSGHVTTIDLDPEVTDEAHRNLDANGYSRITVTCADGAHGDPAGAPWDRILVSVGAWEPSPEWIAQLGPKGRIVMPLAVGRVQRVVAFEPAAYGLRSTQVYAGGFLAQRGRDARPRTTMALDETITIESEGDLGIEAEAARGMFDTEPVTVWTGVELPFPGRFDRAILYLALHYPSLFTMTAPWAFLPGALRAWNVIYGVARDRSVAHLALRASNPADPRTGHEVGVAAYGPEAAGLAAELADDVRAWGRMPEADPIFEVYVRNDADVLDDADAVVIDKRHCRISVTWPAVSATGGSSMVRAPVVHEMRLLEEYMDLLERGKKSVEVRCADAKRRAVAVGDAIVFRCGDRTVRARVERVSRYATFEDLYGCEDAAAINPRRSAVEQLEGIAALYGPDKRALGAVAFALRLLPGNAEGSSI